MLSKLKLFFRSWEIRPLPTAVLLALFQILVNPATIIAAARAQGKFANLHAILVTIPSIFIAFIIGFGLMWLLKMATAKFPRHRAPIYWVGGILYGQGMALSRFISVTDETPAFWADGSSWLRLSVVTAIFYYTVHSTFGLTSFRLQEQVEVANAAKASLEVQRGKLITAQEEVRKQIADFLHDRLQSDLVVLGMQMQRSIEGLEDSEKSVALAYVDEIERIRQFEVRGISRQLAPELDGPSFRPAIDELVGRYKKVFDVGLAISESGRMSKALKLACYRIIEQSLMNAAKHASATKVQIDIQEFGSEVRISITNNGHSLPKQLVPGAGFATIENWVNSFDGSWSIRDVGNKTELMATLNM